jgi:hypothetical protein
MLMLAADALAVIGELPRTSVLLEQAREEELASTDGAVVLADSAIRSMNPRLALRLTESADEADPMVRRIRAEALEEVGTQSERQQALRTLEEIVEQGGSQAPEAAFYRLTCSIGGQPLAEWHEASYQSLMGTRFERAGIITRAHYLAQRKSAYRQAEELLRPHLSELWAKVARVRIAHTWRNTRVLTEAADDLMLAGPSQPYKLEAGYAYRLAGQHRRAQEVFASVARDRAAPPMARAQAYDQLLRIVGIGLGDWKLAARFHDEWVRLRPGDPRHQKYAPMIANRRREANGSG